ncbi:hypothetical protein [Rudanella lutea]|uniref:hypothetical protein n=1 Tax=Rudanella lutea TaxID=451374 RepID=UPI0003715FF4|nr:hypothetical protein [Rudanella lutea]
MENNQPEKLGPHVEVTPEGLVVDFDAIRNETIERYGFAEKPADEPWIIGKVTREDFTLMKEEEAEADRKEEKQ